MATSPESRISISAMTAREQVAITLRVPQSGSEWIDAMILESIRIELIRVQYEGLCNDPVPDKHFILPVESFIEEIVAGPQQEGEETDA